MPASARAPPSNLTMPDRPTLQDLGEQALLKRLQSYCPEPIIGDDGAVLPLLPGHQLVVTTDVLVDGVHFSDRTTPPHAAGWRAAAANLSDLAAMGATPIGITVGLSLPGDCPVDWVEELYRGLTDCLGPMPIVGGDLCRSAVRSVAITALGQVEPDRVLRRSAARPGDAILVTGPHGSSRAGLELLLNPESGLGEADRQALIQAHQYPRPRLDLLAHLSPIMPPPAAMDSSDGLADAVLQICRASGVGARLDRRLIPIAPALNRYQAPDQALDWALYGGEDFELVICLAKGIADRLVQQLPDAAIIGEITAGSDVRLVNSPGPDQILSLDRGFQHFG
jgi:thiamine-monophosphate kinase